MARFREMLPGVCLVFLALFGFCQEASAVYKVPDVKIEAYQPKGFRAYIPDNPGIMMFAFHGNVNRGLQITEPGSFSKDIRKPVDGFWIYENPDVELKIGDVLYYWVSIQHDRLGYRKENKWEVIEFTKKDKPLKCDLSKTVTSSTTDDICRGSLIFEENFGDIDQTRWIIEQYIPTRGPNFEFNSYENSLETVTCKDGKLKIMPIPKRSESQIRGRLDLQFHCTRKQYPEECVYEHFGSYYLPPVRSGKIRSVFSFMFGKIEVRAKLPAGDWIFPEIALIPADQVDSVNASKLWIAYARGNEKYTGENGDDIGGKFLFAGEVTNPYEPQRSANLVSSLGNEPFSKEMHLYSLVWSPGVISAYVDNVKIGERTTTGIFDKCVVSLGVGVGGNNDFPDGYKSGVHEKPWRNRDPKQIKTFFAARNEWLATWRNPDSYLQVDYIKIYAL